MQGITIKKVKEDKCYGCGACFNKCPVNAIKMEYDKDGFIFPKIDETKCTKCGLCQKVCPTIQAKELTKEKKNECYAVWADEETRLVSSSGGMFSILANYILEQGGYVCGAAYTDDFMSVEHIIVDNKNDLAKLRGSKYVESNTKKVYSEIEELLKEDKYVLFSGCPCQVAGLYTFLGKEYEKLYTMDLICHGANSNKAYKSYMNELTQGKKIKKVDFRDKSVFGWATTLTVKLEDGSIIRKKYEICDWYKGFLSGIINRKACSTCEFAQKNRVGDITIGDFWKIGKFNKKYNDEKGTSLVLINTDKGRKAFNSLKNKMELCEKVPFNIAYENNAQLNYPQKKHPKREMFFKSLNHHSYTESLNRVIKDKFDIGIVGWWCNNNYGSIITYFGLRQTLIELGYTVIMIDKLTDKEKPKFEEIEDEPRRFAKKQGYRISKRYNKDNIVLLNNHCDTFIVGSDQMWGYWARNVVGGNYYLDFAWNNKKKIAVATSFGEKNRSEKTWIDKNKPYVQKFDAISVREDYAVEMVKDFYNVDAKFILDPLFLCNRKAYYDIAKKVDIKKEDYILCYILDPDEEKNKRIKYIAKQKNMKVKVILDLDKRGLKAKREIMKEFDIIKATADEWLAYIMNSSLVVTDSFHGTCMSIIFKKSFISFVNYKRGSGRFESLLNTLELTDRMVNNNKELEDNIDILTKEIDYANTYKIIEKMKEEGLNWLKYNLSKEKNSAISEIDILKQKNYELEQKFRQLENKLNQNLYCIEKKKESTIFTQKNKEKFKKSLKQFGLIPTLRRSIRKIKEIKSNKK